MTSRVASAFIAILLGLSPLMSRTAEAAWWKPRAGLTFSILLSVAPRVIDTPARVVDVDLFDIRKRTVPISRRRASASSAT